jgi:hypothetical protein
MSNNRQRLSQLISTFGPGSMIDLPTRSVVVGGLELWEMAGSNAFTLIAEPRSAGRLEQLLRARNLLEPGVRLTLRTPPNSADTFFGVPRGIATPIFPALFVCERVESALSAEGKPVRRRRLVRWQDLDITGRRRYSFDDGIKSDVIPIRFVGACLDGHLQDIDWRWVVHAGAVCHETLWIEEKGTSAHPSDTSIVCGCSRRLSLQEAFQPGRLGPCRGARPWLLDRDPNGCNLPLKLLTRSATNTYFPQVYTVISLPAEEDELTLLVSDLLADLGMAQSVQDIADLKRLVPKLRASLGAYDNADIFDRLQRLLEGARNDAKRSPKLSEFDAFASGRAEIGENHSTAKLYARTLLRSDWDHENDSALKAITSIVAVHRLREVSCLYGFTRFEAAPTSADGDIEDIRLAVRGAPLSTGADWLPAIEQFGEGIFIHFDSAAINSWLQQPAVMQRHAQLAHGYALWKRNFAQAPDYPGTAYVLLHSISHALMDEIALDCGYPATSLKERVYALPLSSTGAPVERCGILIYTASPGAQGTLGGLVAATPRIATILRNALEHLRICSNDPVCADHEPDDRSGDRATHGAACHGCLLIAETSCEMRNLLLDRGLLVSTMAGGRAGFFG